MDAITTPALVCIVYLYGVQTAIYKKKMKRLTDNNSNNTIFNDL